jgi:hypothetical protein
MMIDHYVSRIIQQYYDKPKAVGDITARVTSIKRVFDWLDSFPAEFDLDEATGHRLDLIGKIVGLSRVLPVVATSLTDDEYRFLLKAKIAKNTVSAFMVSDDRLSLQESVQFLFSNGAFVVNSRQMILRLYIDYTVTDAFLGLVVSLDLLPRPAGVDIYAIKLIDPYSFFGFSDNPNAKGFGVGKFASEVAL